LTEAELRAWAEATGVGVTEDGWARLDRLLGLWRQYGRAMNLVGSTDPDALREHVQEGLQCVACVERVRPVDAACCWVDVGSGGGLPGLVVAAVRACLVVLVEPRARRAAFLDLGIASIGVGSGRVIRARWGDSTWNEVAAAGVEPRDETEFYILSSRAVFGAETWLEEASRATLTRGIVLCHVELGSERVGEKKPSTVVRGPRWGVMGFLVGSEG